MPVVVGETTLLDSGKAIDSEKMLERVRSAGVTRLDIDRLYLDELIQNNPGHYEKIKAAVQQEVDHNRRNRAQSADFVVKARQAVPRPPCVSIAGASAHISEMKELLIRYFRIEQVQTGLESLKAGLAKTELTIIFTDDFSDDRLLPVVRELQKTDSRMKFLAVYEKAVPKDFFENRYRFSHSHPSLIEACFFCLYPRHYLEFNSPPIFNARIKALFRPLLHLILSDNLREEQDVFLDGLKGMGLITHHLDNFYPEPEAVLVLLRIKNDGGELVPLLQTIQKSGVLLKRVVVLVDRLEKEELAGLKNHQPGALILGGLSHEKLTNLLGKLPGAKV